MIYLSIALIFAIALISKYGIHITINIKYNINKPQNNMVELKPEDIPKTPTYDEIMQALNEIVYELGGERNK